MIIFLKDKLEVQPFPSVGGTAFEQKLNMFNSFITKGFNF